MPRKFSWNQEEDFQKACITFSIKDGVEWVSINLNPEDVYPIKSLEQWAEENGYVKETP